MNGYTLQDSTWFFAFNVMYVVNSAVMRTPLVADPIASATCLRSSSSGIGNLCRSKFVLQGMAFLMHMHSVRTNDTNDIFRQP